MRASLGRHPRGAIEVGGTVAALTTHLAHLWLFRDFQQGPQKTPIHIPHSEGRLPGSQSESSLWGTERSWWELSTTPSCALGPAPLTTTQLPSLPWALGCPEAVLTLLAWSLGPRSPTQS